MNFSKLQKRIGPIGPIRPMSSWVLVLCLILPLFGLANEPPGFVHDVLPVLSKAGCNTGGCHGALAGKGEFRLSLDGYDPATDHYNITRETRGRRIEFASPARSLLLTKPTAALLHKGGKVLHEDSADYRLLVQWIQAGAPGPQADDPELDTIDILPANLQLRRGDQHSLVVMARFDDGSVRNVTPWVRWTSTDESVATIDDKTGEISVVGHGHGAVTAWYSSRIAIARVTSPYPTEVADAVFDKAPSRNAVDEAVLTQLRSLNLAPAPRCDDATFLRRAYLDVIGVLPTPAETRAFLNKPDRDALIEQLLERPEFVDYWTYRWSDLFLISGKKLRPDAVKTYYQWLRKHVESNSPWDEIARDVVTARGSSVSVEQGASNFYAVHQEPETMAENVSQAFMGLSINCARCHNHPLEKWTNDQYYQFANLFSRVRAKGWGGDARNGDGIRTLFVEPAGDLIQPRTGRPQPPAPLDAPMLDPNDTGDRRDVLADWLTDPANPYFTRAIANRVWAALIGRGIVEDIDDLRLSNPASNEALLQVLAEHLVTADYDLKSLMRFILQSETYQRAAAPDALGSPRSFAAAVPRRLMAEVLHDAIVQVTDVPSTFDQITLSDGSMRKTEFYPAGTRALQLYDSAVSSYFLKTFGRNEREITCECERSAKPSMTQVLHLSNGQTLNQKLADKRCRVAALSKMADPALVEEAYLLSLSRFPSEDERKALLELLAKTPAAERKTAVEDLLWALMTSREFLFQH